MEGIVFFTPLLVWHSRYQVSNQMKTLLCVRTSFMGNHFALLNIHHQTCVKSMILIPFRRLFRFLDTKRHNKRLGMHKNAGEQNTQNCSMCGLQGHEFQTTSVATFMRNLAFLEKETFYFHFIKSKDHLQGMFRNAETVPTVRNGTQKI